LQVAGALCRLGHGEAQRVELLLALRVGALAPRGRLIGALGGLGDLNLGDLALGRQVHVGLLGAGLAGLRGFGHLSSPSVGSVGSSTISASTTSASSPPVDSSVPPAAACSASAAAYIAAPIFWLDSLSLVVPASISSAVASSFASVAFRDSTSAE